METVQDQELLSTPINLADRELHSNPTTKKNIKNIANQIKSIPDNEVFRFFLETYIKNLSNLEKQKQQQQNNAGISNTSSSITRKQGSKKGNKKSSKSNMNGKNTKHHNNDASNYASNTASDNESNTVSSIISKKFEKYITMIMEIYNKPETPILDFKSLFSHLNSQLNDYKQIVSDPVKINEDIDIYYTHTHGDFNFESGFKKIPENMVLVFLTPVNRYGFTCVKTDYQKTIKSLMDVSIKQYLKSQILCTDKIYNEKVTNNRDIKNYFNFFENALVLLPGQYYYDLKLSFSESDSNKSMNIFYFGHNSPEEQPEYKELISDTIFNSKLSSFIEKNENSTVSIDNSNPDKLKYIIVDCCRNIDASILSEKNVNNSKLIKGESIYIYENFMLYFNTIMYKCFIPYSINSFSKKHFGKYGYKYWTDFRIKSFTQNFNSYVGSNKAKIMDEIQKRLTPITQDKLDPKIYINIMMYIKNFKFDNISDDVKIDMSKLLKLFTKYFSFSLIIENNEINYILKQIHEIDNEIFKMKRNYMLHSKILIQDKDGINIDLLNSIKNKMQKFCEFFISIRNNTKDYIVEYYKPFLDYISKLLVFNESLAKSTFSFNTDTYTYESSPLYTYDSSSLIMKILTENNYKSIFDELLSYFQSLIDTVKTNFNIIIPKKLQNKKNSGNKSLGHKGRIYLRKTLLNAQNNLRVDGKLSHKNTIYKSYIDKFYSEVSPFQT